MRPRHNGTFIPAIVAIALLGGVTSLSACGSGQGESSPTGGGQGPGELRITTLGLCNEIPVYWAQDKGLFKKHDVTVKLIKSTGGAAAITALQSGDIDLAFANPFSTMLAIEKGLDLKWIATAYETTNKGADSANAVVVAKESSLSDGKSLNGKTIGVNEVGGINQIITSQWMTLAGGDPSSAKFVALPFNELASSVANGKVDAAQIPKQNIDPSLGLKSLGDPYVAAGQGDHLVFAGYVTTGPKAGKAQTLMKGFQAALIEADKAINSGSHDEERFALAAKRCKQKAALLKKQPENIYAAKVNEASLTRMGSMLEQQGRLEEAPDPADFVPSWVVTK